ncbi:hypothetical protein BaRGS_00025910 [Batillaria attramentaria]|uniref:Uncharacterized protein n=1 Tax=Batillaria attramentaria TaxID=370345 RepID=A0ABD0K6Y8_9CAEN
MKDVQYSVQVTHARGIMLRSQCRRHKQEEKKSFKMSLVIQQFSLSFFHILSHYNNLLWGKIKTQEVSSFEDKTNRTRNAQAVNQEVDHEASQN